MPLQTLKSLRNSLFALAFCLFIVASVESSFAHVRPCLSLDEYLCQVNHCHGGIQGSRKIVHGTGLRDSEAKLLTEPYLFGQAEYIKNVYNPTFAPMQGNESTLENYKLGFEQTTPYGLSGKLYYNYQRQTYGGTNPLFVTATDFYSTSPVVEFNLSLWRNFLGRETRATQSLIQSQARYSHFSERYKIKTLLAQAENTYWRMALAQRVVTIQLDSLARARKIHDWATRRTQLRLADRADSLQAEAGVDARQLDLQSAIDELKLAAHAFNTLRGNACDIVPEQLINLNDDLLQNIPIPCFHPLRDDVLAAKEQTNIAIANARLGIEKNKPDLDVYATYSFNGRNTNASQAINESFSSTYPNSVIGVRLRMPLDYVTQSRVRNGYRHEIQGVEEQFQQQVFENHQLWNELIIRLETAKKRLHIAKRLEDIQLEKLTAEKQRLSVGRTTLYQVLLFEQDYANAQIARLNIQAEILGYVTQLKTFGVCV